MGRYAEDIGKALSEAGADAGSEACLKLEAYMEAVLEKNESINLTAITESDSFITGHFADSAAIITSDPYKRAEKVIDVGTGAGFPGMVLAILSPEKEFVLLDSLAKRLKVISEIAAELDVDNVEFVHKRAEDAGRDKDMREKFDLAVSRAVAPLPVLAELCAPLVKVGGFFAAYKGKSLGGEIADSEKAFKILGLGEPLILDSGVSGLEHYIVTSEKKENTPGAYPRKAGTPARKPL